MHKKINSQDVHVCFVTDNNYMIHTATVIASILSNSNTRDTYSFHILTSEEISASHRRKVNKLKKIRDFHVEYIPVPPERTMIFEPIRRNPWVSLVTYNRTLMPELLPHVDKAIYLDSDLVVMHDIATLYAFNVDDCYMCGVEDLNYANFVKALGYSKEYTYINSGVYLVNLKAMREENYYEHMTQVVKKEHSKYIVAEQCVINSCFHEKIKRLPHKWNMYHIFLNRPKLEFKPYNLDAWHDGIRNPAIVHFVGPDKPWSWDSHHPYRDAYLKYLRLTPYRGLIYKNFCKRILHAFFHKSKITLSGKTKIKYRFLGMPVFSNVKTANKRTIKIVGIPLAKNYK